MSGRAPRRDVRLGVASDPRHRPTMEDRWAAGAVDDGLLVAVFDGHGGVDVADWASGQALEAARAASAAGLEGGAFWTAIFARLDPDVPWSGSTATLVLVEGARLSAAWVGDSRALRVTADSWHFLTQDHRIDRPEEVRRCLDAGAVLEPPYVMDPRTSNGLMMTRALGDRALRRIGIIPEPEVIAVALSPTDRGVVVATDGLWDVVDNAEAAAVCRELPPQRAADRLVELVVRRDGTDNVTVVVACL